MKNKMKKQKKLLKKEVVVKCLKDPILKNLLIVQRLAHKAGLNYLL